MNKGVLLGFYGYLRGRLLLVIKAEFTLKAIIVTLCILFSSKLAVNDSLLTALRYLCSFLDIKYIYYFPLIAIFEVLISCINGILVPVIFRNIRKNPYGSKQLRSYSENSLYEFV